MELSIYDNNCKRAFELSKQEASKNNEHIITTGHLLIGLLKTNESTANQALIRFAVTPEKVQECLRVLSREIETKEVKNKKHKGDVIELEYSSLVKQACKFATELAEENRQNLVKTEHLLLGLLNISECEAIHILNQLGVKKHHIEDKIKYLYGRNNMSIPGSESKPVIKSSILSELCTDLTLLAKQNTLDPVYGRDKEIDRAISILMRRSKNNPVFVGEPGVGKTALVEGIAQEIIKGNIPNSLQNKRILSLEIGALIAGTKFRGEFEERLRRIVEEIRNDKNIILFIDEIHTIVGAGNAEGAIDAANILKPALSRGGIQCIGATTHKEYKFIESDGALERRFQPIFVEEPSIEEAEQILYRLKNKYETHHKIKISDSAIKYAVLLSSRYINNRYLPDKCIDLIDESAAKLRLSAYRKSSNSEELTLTETDVSRVLSEWTGIPVSKLEKKETAKLLAMKEILNRRIIGQNHVVQKVVDSIIRARTGLKNAKRPIGSFIFLGPTGVGKTLLANLLAEQLFGNEKAVIRVDMSEYMEAYNVSRLIGAAPGHVGYDDGGQLTEKVRKNPYSIILFDEMEKAHPDIFNVLLQVLEDGRLTDNRGQTVNFSNTIIIFTSNIGYSNNIARVGFTDSSKNIHVEGLSRFYKPEFLNRIDEIVTFNEINKEHLEEIVELLLNELVEKLKGINISISPTQKLKEYLLENGYDKEMGVRPLRRLIENQIEKTLSYAVLKNELLDGDFVEVDFQDNDIILNKVSPSSVKLVNI